MAKTTYKRNLRFSPTGMDSVRSGLGNLIQELNNRSAGFEHSGIDEISNSGFEHVPEQLQFHEYPFSSPAKHTMRFGYDDSARQLIDMRHFDNYVAREKINDIPGAIHHMNLKQVAENIGDAKLAKKHTGALVRLVRDAHGVSKADALDTIEAAAGKPIIERLLLAAK